MHAGDCRLKFQEAVEDPRFLEKSEALSVGPHDASKWPSILRLNGSYEPPDDR